MDIIVSQELGDDANDGVTHFVQTISRAVELLYEEYKADGVTPNPLYQQKYVRIYIDDGIYTQALDLQNPQPGEERFPLKLPHMLTQISFEPLAPVPGLDDDTMQFTVAIEDTTTVPYVPGPLLGSYSMFTISPYSQIRFKDMRIRAWGNGVGTQPGQPAQDYRGVVDFGVCGGSLGAGSGPIGGSGLNCNWVEPAGGFTCKVLFDDTRLEVDRAVGHDEDWSYKSSAWSYGGKLDVCLLDSTVECQVTNSYSAGTGYKELVQRSQYVVYPKVWGEIQLQINAHFQRTRVAGHGLVAVWDPSETADETKVRVRAFNTDVREYPVSAISIPAFDGTPAGPGKAQIKLWQCSFHTSQTNLATGNAPVAIDVASDMALGFPNSVYNTAFAGHSEDWVGGVPASVTWNGIATTNYLNGSFVDASGTLILQDLSAAGTGAWFSDPLIGLGSAVDLLVPRSEAHVKPVCELVDSGYTGISDPDGRLEFTVYHEPRTGGANTIPDIGADESWSHRGWALGDPRAPDQGIPGAGKVYFRAVSPGALYPVLGLDPTPQTQWGTLPHSVPAPTPGIVSVPVIDGTFDPAGATPFLNVLSPTVQTFTFSTIAESITEACTGSPASYSELSMTLQPLIFTSQSGAQISLTRGGTWWQYQVGFLNFATGAVAYAVNTDAISFLK